MKKEKLNTLCSLCFLFIKCFNFHYRYTSKNSFTEYYQTALVSICQQFESLNAHLSETLVYRQGFSFLCKSVKFIIPCHCVSFIMLWR